MESILIRLGLQPNLINILLIYRGVCDQSIDACVMNDISHSTCLRLVAYFNICYYHVLTSSLHYQSTTAHGQIECIGLKARAVAKLTENIIHKTLYD